MPNAFSRDDWEREREENFRALRETAPHMHPTEERKQALIDRLKRYESVLIQTRMWVDGNPVHNTLKDECCPDFSCCVPELLMPEGRRIEHAERIMRRLLREWAEAKTD